MDRRTITDAAIEAEIIAALSRRDASASSCPSEIARALAPQDERAWRGLMPRIRAVLAPLVDAGRVRVTRGRVTLAGGEFQGGPIRIRRGQQF